MQKTLLDLREIAMRPLEARNGFESLDLPQVHALNCMKDIYTNTRLGPHSEVHLPEGLDLAALCLESKMLVERSPLSFMNEGSLTFLPDGQSKTVVSCSSEP